VVGILLITLLTSSCGNFNKPFPTKNIWGVPLSQACIRHEIIKQNPLTVSKGQIIQDPRLCPIYVIGFDSEDVPRIQAWIIEAQTGKKPNEKNIQEEGRKLRQFVRSLEVQ
jgi:hypothetical protein